MAVSPRTRFEILKRDNFTCRYCARSTPDVVLEIDHIIPVYEGGADDPMNLAVSCWDCNRGKAGVPLADVMTGEDPHDRAILLLERERQLKEYNVVLKAVNERIDSESEKLVCYWNEATGKTIYGAELSGLRNALSRWPSEVIRVAMDSAKRARKTASLAYVHACLNR